MTQVKNQRAVSHSFIASSSDITGHVWKYKQDNDSSCLEPERIQRMKLQTHYGLDWETRIYQEDSISYKKVKSHFAPTISKYFVAS